MECWPFLIAMCRSHYKCFGPDSLVSKKTPLLELVDPLTPGISIAGSFPQQ